MKLGFIGCGNMATAIIKGIVSNGILDAGEIIASCKTVASREKAKASLGIQMAEGNREVVEKSEVFVLAVKPQFFEEVIAEIKDVVREEQMVITLAPGKTLAWLEEQFGKPLKIIRTMPNTPAMVQEGMTAACPNQYVTDEDMAYVISILEGCGAVEVVPERLIDAVVAVSGSSPAYIYMLIEAMADAAVAEGMPRDIALKMAAQAVLGSAKMVLETGMHPGQLHIYFWGNGIGKGL